MSEPEIICDGYYVELAAGGPWLTEQLSWTTTWAERHCWPTEEKARAAADAAIMDNENETGL